MHVFILKRQGGARPMMALAVTGMIRACLLWQWLQHGLQGRRIAASKGLPLALDAVPSALCVPLPLTPLLPHKGASMALLVRACLSLTLAWLFLQCHCTISTPACLSLCSKAMLQIVPHTAQRFCASWVQSVPVCAAAPEDQV